MGMRMGRELSPAQLIERSIQKKYRKELYALTAVLVLTMVMLSVKIVGRVSRKMLQPLS